ncbi:CLUMA_CG017414, isoform A [Clunio marinus]|uniref:non-specific serine/threonine protein kinase n=1 Tax=Clunio marinus TaxID=568069 RepID=A0A1J1IVW5_9DIPT|nr:CLUMA_CG017414, isoform A [Clunio marinus]
MNESSSISARTTRLNSLILGRPEALPKEQKEICAGINRDGLLDALFLLHQECSKDSVKKKNKNIQNFASKYRPIIRETKQLRVNVEDFVVKTLIGSGYFGEVHLVTDKCSHDVYAMKTINKKSIVGNCQVREERDIMVLGRKCEWITRLQYAFQDRENLYLVMEYLPGGDLLGLMIRFGAFDEELARFYLAEIALALNALHSMGFVHRDVKPENILLDRFGHLKLADFGSAVALNEDGSFMSLSPAGTPDYIAPELLSALSTKESQKDQKLDASCDFWSMGIIGFEMVTEKTPFHNENVYDTYSEIQNYSEDKRSMKSLEFPSEMKVSRNFKDFLNSLVTKASRRLTFDEIEDHPFFSGIEWHNLRDQAPPIIPTLSGEEDTSNFDDVDVSIKRSPVKKKITFAPQNPNEFSGDDFPFLGFTYIYEESSKFLKSSSKTSESRLESKIAGKIDNLQDTIKEQMREIKELQKELLSAERKATQMISLEKMYEESKEDVEKLNKKLKEKVGEVATMKTEMKMLKNELDGLKKKLKIEEENQLKHDTKIADVLSQTYKKWEKAKKISDNNYEKQLKEAKGEVSNLMDRIKTGNDELSEKIEECQHLNKVLEQYKEMLETAKSQHSKDKNECENLRKQISSDVDMKIQEMKRKLKDEKDERIKSEESQLKLRKELSEAVKTSSELKESKEATKMEISAIRKQLNEKIDEINRLMKCKKELDQQVEQSNRKNDELRKEMLKIQEDNIKKQLRLSKIVSQPIQVGGCRSSNEGEFKSAHGSLTELNIAVDTEDLKNDLVRARESEDIQRKRADNLEEVVQRLEEMIKKVNKTNENTAGGLLERQNEKLEDQLATIREQSILDRQSARTANLQLWKLEKEVSDIKHEKSILSRRIETANEKCSSAIHEKESIELKMKQQLETINSKETQIIDLQKDIRHLKFELKQEREKWTSNERDRLREKTEIIEGNSRIKNLEEKLREANNKVRLLELKVSALSDEKEILQRRLNEERNLHQAADENVKELQKELKTIQANHKILLEAAQTTENLADAYEERFNDEVKRNKANTEKIDDLWSKVRSRDETIAKMKHELSQEKSLKMSAEAKGCQLQNEYDEMKEDLQGMQNRMLDLQQQLVKKQEFLYEAQENVEITNADLQHLQKMKMNYESEIQMLKEETSRILTDFYRSKEEVKRLTKELKDARTDIDEMDQEKDHLNSLLSELRTHSKERDIRTEATVSQQKKLIEYLTQRVEELQNKKKRTIAEVLFGANPPNHPPVTPRSSRKENVAPNAQDTIKLKKIEDDLKKERERNQRLKENLMQTKLEIRKSASTKSPERVNHQSYRESTVETNDFGTTPSRTITATIHAEPEKKVENEYRQSDSSPKVHHFAMTIETASPAPNAPPTLCLACERIILIGQPYWQCKECKLSVHRKCRGFVKSHCLLGDGISATSSSSTTDATSDTTASIVVPIRRNSKKHKSVTLDDVDGIKPFSDDVSSIGSGSDLALNSYHGDHILNSSRFGFGWGMATAPRINAAYALTENIILFGCSNGLFSYRLDDNEIVQIKGISSVNYFAIKSDLTKSIMIGDNGDNLYECDIRNLMNKSRQSGMLEAKLEIHPLDLSIANRCADEKWHMVALHGTSEHLNDAIAIAATNSRIVILKYDAKSGRFKPVRSLDTVTAINSILFTQHSAIVSCDKFFEIDLNSFVAEEFLDMSDQSLRPTKVTQPMNVFRINSNEFLLCFRDYGVFVDEYGLRSRQENLEWLHSPKEFFYKNYLLFIIHDEMIQILRINNSTKKHEKDLLTDNNQSRTFVMIDNEKKFTFGSQVNDQSYLVNVLRNVDGVNGTITQDLITIDAEKAFKINLNRSMSSIISDSSTSLATMSSVGATSNDTVN